MTIPDSLSARRAELEAELKFYGEEARDHAARSSSARLLTVMLCRAELHGITQSIEAYEAAEPIPVAAPEKRERRDLRGLVLGYINRGAGGIAPTSSDIKNELGLPQYQVADLLDRLAAQGLIVSDGAVGWLTRRWRLVHPTIAGEV